MYSKFLGGFPAGLLTKVRKPPEERRPEFRPSLVATGHFKVLNGFSGVVPFDRDRSADDRHPHLVDQRIQRILLCELVNERWRLVAATERKSNGAARQADSVAVKAQRLRRLRPAVLAVTECRGPRRRLGRVPSRHFLDATARGLIDRAANEILREACTAPQLPSTGPANPPQRTRQAFLAPSPVAVS